MEDFGMKLPPETPDIANKRMDSILDGLRNKINTVNKDQLGGDANKDLGLDIELINETCTPAPMTKSSFKFPSIPPTNRSQGQSFKLLQSPNSVFSQRKKNF